MDGQPPYQKWLPTMPRMVTHHPKDGHPPSQIWSPTKWYFQYLLHIACATDHIACATDRHEKSGVWFLNHNFQDFEGSSKWAEFFTNNICKVAVVEKKLKLRLDLILLLHHPILLSYFRMSYWKYLIEASSLWQLNCSFAIQATSLCYKGYQTRLPHQFCLS